MRPRSRVGTTAAVRSDVVPRLPAFRMAPNSSLFRIRRSRPKRALTGDMNRVAAGIPRILTNAYAPRRCLPLARRLLITSLPPRDLMRTRKP